MDKSFKNIETLENQIIATEAKLQMLKEQLATLKLGHLDENATRSDQKWPLSSEEYKRYGRQMIVPSMGIGGQLRLKSSSVLLVGAGGLGCPAAAYLSGAGVGTIGIVDGDVVELSNLHRQILHNTARVGMKKVDSATEYLKTLNPDIKYNTYPVHLTPENSQSIVSQYDLVLDCTDHPTSRYLISDICVLLSKPLISASALRTDGQLIVLNSPPLPPGDLIGGPCYRCVFPKPPPAQSVVSCGDGGILGPVVGVMGVLQALEAIKLISSGRLVPLNSNGAGMPNEANSNSANMLLFSAKNNPPFRTVRLRSRRVDCFACSADGGLTLKSLTDRSLDYVLFCGVNSPVEVLRPEERITAAEYEERRTRENHLLLDVREKIQFDICNLEGSVNVPFSTIQGHGKSCITQGRPSWLPEDLPQNASIYVVCRLGNDSQVVTKTLKDAGLGESGRFIGDIKDGFKSWKKHVDNSWPEY